MQAHPPYVAQLAPRAAPHQPLRPRKSVLRHYSGTTAIDADKTSASGSAFSAQKPK
jgi:hypothetical protein